MMLSQEDYEKKPEKKGVPIALIVSIALVLCIGLGVSIVFFVAGIMKSSAAYAEGMKQLINHPEAVAYLGEPIESGFFVSGNINISGPTGNAQIAIPVSGSKQAGTVYVQGQKSMGKWHFPHVLFRGKQDDREIDLIGMRSITQ
jgi:hypothetical protein